MGAPKQTGRIKVKCSICGKDAEVLTAEYYKAGGLKGGCCKKEKQVNALAPDGTKTKDTVEVGNTWITVPSGKSKFAAPVPEPKKGKK